jgi:ELWxxDGT repeat protein
MEAFRFLHFPARSPPGPLTGRLVYNAQCHLYHSHFTHEKKLLPIILLLVYFTADDGATGAELWQTDGTAAGTVRVKDILPVPAADYGDARDGNQKDHQKVAVPRDNP